MSPIKNASSLSEEFLKLIFFFAFHFDQSPPSKVEMELLKEHVGNVPS